MFKSIWNYFKAVDWKALSGFLLVCTGAFVGLYVGIWICFIGGIAAFIEAVTADPIPALDVAIAFGRFWFSALIGWAAAALFIVPGLKLLK